MQQQHTQHNVHGINEDKLNVHMNGLEGLHEVDDEEEEEEYDGYLEVRQMEVRFLYILCFLLRSECAVSYCFLCYR